MAFVTDPHGLEYLLQPGKLWVFTKLGTYFSCLVIFLKIFLFSYYLVGQCIVLKNKRFLWSRLERLQRIVSKVQMESGVCEEQLNQMENLLQSVSEYYL